MTTVTTVALVPHVPHVLLVSLVPLPYVSLVLHVALVSHKQYSIRLMSPYLLTAILVSGEWEQFYKYLRERLFEYKSRHEPEER